MSELKDYDIMDIEAMDDERLEKSESGKIQVTRVYIKSDVDAAIDELKAEHHKERHEYIEMVAQLKAENERLKDELDAANNQCENLINSATDIMLRQDKVNDAKCDEVESLKATHYAEMVDAGMRERRLKRALWLARGYIMTLLQRDFQRLAYQCNNGDYKKNLLNRRNRYYDLYEKCRAKVEKFK